MNSINGGYATSGCHLQAVKCTETYGTPSFARLGCLSHTEFLNCKNEFVKYKLCSSSLAAQTAFFFFDIRTGKKGSGQMVSMDW